MSAALLSPEESTKPTHRIITSERGDIQIFMVQEGGNFFQHFEKVALVEDQVARTLIPDIITRYGDWKAQGRVGPLGARKNDRKAREAYNILLVEECLSYEAMKSAVLKSFHLTPEAYRRKWREHVKTSGKTYARQPGSWRGGFIVG